MSAENVVGQTSLNSWWQQERQQKRVDRHKRLKTFLDFFYIWLQPRLDMMLIRPFADKKPLQPLGNENTLNCRCLGFFFHFFVRTSKRSNKSVVYGLPSNLSPFVPALHRLKWTPSSYKKKKKMLLFGGETFYPVDDGADSRLCATESTFSEHTEVFELDVPSFSIQRCTKEAFLYSSLLPKTCSSRAFYRKRRTHAAKPLKHAGRTQIRHVCLGLRWELDDPWWLL